MYTLNTFTGITLIYLFSCTILQSNEAIEPRKKRFKEVHTRTHKLPLVSVPKTAKHPDIKTYFYLSNRILAVLSFTLLNHAFAM